MCTCSDTYSRYTCSCTQNQVNTEGFGLTRHQWDELSGDHWASSWDSSVCVCVCGCIHVSMHPHCIIPYPEAQYIFYTVHTILKRWKQGETKNLCFLSVLLFFFIGELDLCSTLLVTHLWETEVTKHKKKSKDRRGCSQPQGHYTVSFFRSHRQGKHEGGVHEMMSGPNYSTNWCPLTWLSICVLGPIKGEAEIVVCVCKGQNHRCFIS